MYANPTPLRIGATANFAGKNYRVAGRVVMGVVDDGETYYWNEFNLESDDGSCLDLVYEETERGGEWRLFTMFEPDAPMTAADAATKRVGDHLNLDGVDVHVTLVDTSRIYYIEGKAPEGEEVGDVAHYFNAVSGDIMDVVSWTGEDVEYYHGKNLSSRDIENAFNIRLPVQPFQDIDTSWNKYSDGEQTNWSRHAGLFIVIIIFLFVFASRDMSCSSTVRNPLKRIAATTPPLTVGVTGRWNDKNYRVTAHAVVEIAQVNLFYERNEYQLTDDEGTVALLVCGEGPDAKDWEWFTELDPWPRIAPNTAAAQKLGDLVHVDVITATVDQLFRSTINQIDGSGTNDWQNGHVLYGYQATFPNGLLLARWDPMIISIHKGTLVPAKEIKAAFAGSTGQ
jgi:hypothetical protein